MRAPPLPDWTGRSTAETVTDEATPIAAALLLRAADDACVDLGAGPYAACGRLYVGGTDRYVGQMVAPASRHARVHLTGCFQTGAYPDAPAPTPYAWWTTTGGTTGNDVCSVPSVDPRAATFPSNIVSAFIFERVLSAETLIDDTSGLSAPANRMGVLAQHLYPRVEAMRVSGAAGHCVFVAEQSPDLEAL